MNVPGLLGVLRSSFFHPEYGWKTTHFWGPVCNWFIVGAAASDALTKGPEVISLPMTGTLTVYSALFMLFSVRVQPRNYLLLACHVFNIGAQTYQLKRGYEYQEQLREKGTETTSQFSPGMFGVALGSMAFLGVMGPRLQPFVNRMKLPAYLQERLNSPAGPFTVHFWAPTFKWALSISNIMDFNRPVDNMSLMQQTALCATGFIWARYSLVIKPKNFNLFAVNCSLASTGTYQLSRKLKYEWNKSNNVANTH